MKLRLENKILPVKTCRVLIYTCRILIYIHVDIYKCMCEGYNNMIIVETQKPDLQITQTFT